MRLRRGAFLESASLASDPYVRDRQVLLARIAAVVAQSGPSTVVSHASAAALWGLPLERLPARVEIVKPVRRAGCAAPDVMRRVRRASPSELAVRRGIPVTSLLRTALDCALTLPGSGGLVVVDAALAAGVSRDACREVLAGLVGARGVRTAREVVALADDGAESAGESLVRWVVLCAGLPPPVTQVPLETHLGTFWGDLGWPEWRLVVEYDGAGKYADAPADVLRAEKRRQEAIEEAGWRVIRVTAADLRRPTVLVGRLLRFAPPHVAGSLAPRGVLL